MSSFWKDLIIQSILISVIAECSLFVIYSPSLLVMVLCASGGVIALLTLCWRLWQPFRNRNRLLRQITARRKQYEEASKDSLASFKKLSSLINDFSKFDKLLPNYSMGEQKKDKGKEIASCLEQIESMCSIYFQHTSNILLGMMDFLDITDECLVNRDVCFLFIRFNPSDLLQLKNIKKEAWEQQAGYSQELFDKIQMIKVENVAEYNNSVDQLINEWVGDNSENGYVASLLSQFVGTKHYKNEKFSKREAAFIGKLLESNGYEGLSRKLQQPSGADFWETACDHYRKQAKEINRRIEISKSIILTWHAERAALLKMYNKLSEMAELKPRKDPPTSPSTTHPLSPPTTGPSIWGGNIFTSEEFINTPILDSQDLSPDLAGNTLGDNSSPRKNCDETSAEDSAPPSCRP